MTTIVAIRKNNRTSVVSDSLITYGSRRKEARKLQAPCSKLFFCRNVVIGFSGAHVWDLCLKELLGSSEIGEKTCNAKALKKTFSHFWEVMRDKYKIVPFPDERFTSFSPGQIVVASSDSLFEITIEGCVIENKNVVVIGNGRPFAYGAVKVLEPFFQDPYELAVAGITTAATWDPHTQGPFSGWNISESGIFSEFTIS